MSESRRQEVELQLRIEQARQDGVGTEQAQDRGMSRTQVRAPLPKLPKFDESTTDRVRERGRDLVTG